MKNFQKTSRMASMMLILAVLVLPLNLIGQGSKTDFTGSWAYNAEKSNTGQATGQGQGRGGFAGGDFTAKQEANLLTVERTMRTPDGQSNNVVMKYTLDGTESTNSTGRGTSKSSASWSADGKILTIRSTRSFERNGETMSTKSTDVWSMPDKNSVMIVTTSSSPNGERTITTVYNRK
ncbi:MAG: hypothetical protein MUC78_00895 [Bacteroidales bacterium]|jgi:hypothetical protein|nr:hypothetical protein [Bacteroidales bacterium]